MYGIHCFALNSAALQDSTPGYWLSMTLDPVRRIWEEIKNTSDQELVKKMSVLSYRVSLYKDILLKYEKVSPW